MILGQNCSGPRAILKLFSTGKTCRDIGNEQGIGKSTATNLFHGAIKNMQKRIETARREGRESQQLASILAVVNGVGEGDHHAPKAKGLADIEESHTARSLSVAGALAERNRIKRESWTTGDNEDYADPMLDDGSQAE